MNLIRGAEGGTRTRTGVPLPSQDWLWDKQWNRRMFSVNWWPSFLVLKSCLDIFYRFRVAVIFGIDKPGITGW